MNGVPACSHQQQREPAEEELMTNKSVAILGCNNCRVFTGTCPLAQQQASDLVQVDYCQQ